MAPAHLGRLASRIALTCVGTAALALATAGHTLARPLPVVQQSAPINVVAGENFYGDIVTQLGAGHVTVTSILSDPNADPHEYESDANDAKAIAGAQLVIENGVGYDDFVDKLMSASSNSARVVINAGNLVGRSAGDNPHLWYNVNYVVQLSGAITADLEQLDPADKADYDAANSSFQSNLGLLQDTMATIKAQYAGVRAAQTEPVAGYMMANLGISVDDGDFQHAIEEGDDPSPQSVAAIQEQIKDRHVAALLYNVQTVSPITDDLQALAKRSGVPIVPVSETQPPNEPSYQQWMVDQLNVLQQALAQGVGQ